MKSGYSLICEKKIKSWIEWNVKHHELIITETIMQFFINFNMFHLHNNRPCMRVHVHILLKIKFLKIPCEHGNRISAKKNHATMCTKNIIGEIRWTILFFFHMSSHIHEICVRNDNKRFLMINFELQFRGELFYL